VYTQTSPGRGETGADISAIPTDAIERVEILRCFCTIRIRCDCWGNEYYLEKSTSGGSVTLRTGITGKEMEKYGNSVNNGTSR
jgi:iron complex outermembrane receptor protein